MTLRPHAEHPGDAGYLAHTQGPHIELIRAYISQHGNEALARNGDPESRTYAIGWYACPEQLGNRMHHFLNAFAGAVVSNRTLVWRYCTAEQVCPASGSAKRCNEFFQRREWIPPWTAIESSPAASSRKGQRLEMLHRLPGYPERLVKAPSFLRAVEHFKPGFLKLHPSTDQISCCGIDALPSRAVDFGVLEQREMHALTSHGALLGDAARLRVSQLFAHGAAVAYGALFEAAFRPTEQVLAAHADEKQYLHGRTVVALHARHFNPKSDGSDTRDATACLKQVLRDRMRPCTVIVATDRAPTLARLAPTVGSLGCTLLTSPAAGGNNGSSNAKGLFEEHGRGAAWVPRRTSSSRHVPRPLSSAQSNRVSRSLCLHGQPSMRPPRYLRGA